MLSRSQQVKQQQVEANAQFSGWTQQLWGIYSNQPYIVVYNKFIMRGLMTAERIGVLGAVNPTAFR